MCFLPAAQALSLDGASEECSESGMCQGPTMALCPFCGNWHILLLSRATSELHWKESPDGLVDKDDCHQVCQLLTSIWGHVHTHKLIKCKKKIKNKTKQRTKQPDLPDLRDIDCDDMTTTCTSTLIFQCPRGIIKTHLLSLSFFNVSLGFLIKNLSFLFQRLF